MATKLEWANVDYWRATHPDHSLYDRWQSCLAEERIAAREAGVVEKNRWMLGYYGPFSEHFFIGKSDAGAMVQVSSDWAAKLWKHIANVGGRSSRVDIAITMHAEEGPDAVLQRHYNELAVLRKTRGRPVEPQLTQRPSGARMVTIGSRQSEVYGRIYDKGKESGLEEYQGAVRWEVEIKGKTAHKFGAWLSESTRPRYAIFQASESFWRERGCNVEWQWTENEKELPKQKPKASIESKLAWLATQVAGNIDFLVKEGYHQEVARALTDKVRDSENYGELTLQLSQMLQKIILGGKSTDGDTTGRV